MGLSWSSCELAVFPQGAVPLSRSHCLGKDGRFNVFFFFFFFFFKFLILKSTPRQPHFNI